MERVEAVFFANAGIILETEGEQIGIDLFPSDPEGCYEDLSWQQLGQILSRVRTGALKTLIFTHEHRDHFSPAWTLEAAAQARAGGHRLTILSTRAVLERLCADGKAPEGARLLLAEGPAMGGALSAEGVYRTAHAQITFRTVPHDGREYREVENLLVMFRMGGRTIVFPGDALPDPALFERIRGWSREVDWLFAPFPYYGKRSVQGWMREALTLRHIALLHFPAPQSDPCGLRERTKKACSSLPEGLPAPVFLPEDGNNFILS